MNMMPTEYLNRIVTGDCRELARAIPDASIDLIFTDPPYLKECLPLYDWLFQEAARVLKPDGFLLTYVGGYWKDDIMAMARQHLAYFWDYTELNGGNSTPVWPRRTIAKGKSILAYRHKGSDALPRTNVLSVWQGGGRQKWAHDWQQGEDTARYYIDCFSRPGDLVLEPFAGGGTVPLVCRVLRRQYVAFEIDAESATAARKRLEVVQPLLFDAGLPTGVQAALL